jgi:hypothetical protein
MAVIEIDELFDGRSGTWDVANGRGFTRRFRALCSSVLDGPNTVKAALGVRYGDKYLLAETTNDQYAYVVSIDAQQEEGDALGWIVTVTYGAFDANTAGGGPDNNPLLQPIDVQWTFRNQEVVCQYDVNGNAILNTAGDPFDPPLVVDDPRPMLTVVRNEASIDLSWLYTYRTAVNSDPFAGWPPQMARVIQISPRSVFHQFVGWYWQVTYEFEFNPPMGYRPKILNMGLRKKSQAAANRGQLVPIVINGQPINQPMMLTKQGYVAKPTDPPYFVQPQVYPELPFAAFNFDPVAIAGQRSGFNEGYGGQ